MSNIPADLKYTKDHEWLKLVDEDTVLLGITDYAQTSLGDVTFVELPEEGDSFSKGESFSVVESVKAASDIYLPVDGEVLEVNTPLEDSPELINQDPYGDGWLAKFKVTDASGLTDLLSAEDYTPLTAE
ncbi:MAG: glycine cleavage system protein GcvH [Opitutales bacterium]|jgi:glycine cleavage system H protein|nr:glycine cleavage system protein GcvH [Opitutales bacterium]MDG2168824.1 glycine cleavage system protein GcvH [Opitutales bacterium]